MKRVISVLCLVILLLAGSIPVFADPHAVPPDIESTVSVIGFVEEK